MRCLFFWISGLLILACFFWAKTSSDYRNTPLSYNLGQNHEKLSRKSDRNKRENKNKMALEPRSINQRDELSR